MKRAQAQSQAVQPQVLGVRDLASTDITSQVDGAPPAKKSRGGKTKK